jgi:hypothetical protein
LLLFKDGGGHDHAFAALLDACAQEQRAQVLLDGAGADFEFGGDFFVAASADQQLQHLLIAAGDFDLFQIDHDLPRRRRVEGPVCAAVNEKARVSPKFRHTAQRDKSLWMLHFGPKAGIASNHKTSGISLLWDELCHNEKRAWGRTKERLGEAYASPAAMWI